MEGLIAQVSQSAIPNLFAAVLILGIAYVVGRTLANIVTNVLSGLGVNTLPARLGFPALATQGTRTPAAIGGTLVLAALMTFAGIEALHVLGFAQLAALLTQLTVLAGQIALGVVIVGVGLVLANVAARAVLASGVAQAPVLALVVRIAVLALIGAMGLRQMGLANEIINLAFGLLLGAIAVATALAFGLGGRESAGRIVEGWRQSLGATSEPLSNLANAVGAPITIVRERQPATGD